ncbi:MAG: type VII secretion target [Micromonosporaceae bacterium]|jgi:hypothetical protein
MTFKADPVRIREFGDAVAGLKDDAEAALQYLSEHLGIGYSKGRIFATVVEAATSVREALTANYRHLADLVDASGGELRRAADRYQETDIAEQERLDRTYQVPQPR